MVPKKTVLAINRHLRRLIRVDKKFGKKIVVFSGDFRQILLVVPGEYPNECIHSLLFWTNVVKLQLQENIRYTNAAG